MGPPKKNYPNDRSCIRRKTDFAIILTCPCGPLFRLAYTSSFPGQPSADATTEPPPPWVSRPCQRFAGDVDGGGNGVRLGVRRAGLGDSRVRMRGRMFAGSGGSEAATCLRGRRLRNNSARAGGGYLASPLRISTGAPFAVQRLAPSGSPARSVSPVRWPATLGGGSSSDRAAGARG